MSSKSTLRPAFGDLEVADRVELGFVAGDLERVVGILQDALGIVPRWKHERESVKRFKLACAVNHHQMLRASELVVERIEEALSMPVNWAEAWGYLTAELELRAAEIFAGGADGRPPVAWDPDYLLALAAGRDKDLRDTLERAHGKALVSALAVKVRAVVSEAPVLLLEARAACMDQAQEVVASRVGVEVVRIRWDGVPGKLSGAYVRALSWMWAELPEAAKKLLGQ